MTPLEIAELPKAWAIGGDGGMGDIGFQNVSKVVLQNRPNVKLLMLDTQVYSNTGGQNSDSSLMTGGFDMNQIGAATQGKLTEKKGLAEIFTVRPRLALRGAGLDGQRAEVLQGASSTRSSTAAPRSCRPSPPASPSTASATT